MTLETWELADARADFATVMPDTATIQSATFASDGQLGSVPTWTTQSAIPARLIEVKPSARFGLERLVGERFEGTILYKLVLPEGTTIATANRVLCDGRTLEVVSVTPAMSDRLTIVAIVVEQDPA